MPGSPTAPGRTGARIDAPVRIAFRQRNSVGTRDEPTFAAQWQAYAIPCRRFASALAGIGARLGADAVCYSFIVVDLHHLLLAGLPAHSEKGQPLPGRAVGLGPVRVARQTGLDTRCDGNPGPRMVGGLAARTFFARLRHC